MLNEVILQKNFDDNCKKLHVYDCERLQIVVTKKFVEEKIIAKDFSSSLQKNMLKQIK